MSTRGLAEVRRHPTRYAAVLASVAIAVAFLSAILAFLATEQRGLERSVLGAAAKADLVVSYNPEVDHGGWKSDVAGTTARLAAIDGVEAVEAQLSGGATVGGQYAELLSAPGPRFSWVDLSAGRWPNAPNEIVLPPDLARQLGLGLGDRLNASMMVTDKEHPATFTVTGLSDPGRSLLSGMSQQLFVSPEVLSDTRPGGALYTLALAPGADQQAVLTRVKDALGAGPLEVRTARDYAGTLLDGLTAGVDVFRAIGMSFGAIAVLVGSLIIANTFTILLAGRRRWIGLLRAVGATTGQVRADLVVEALVLGVLGSTLGVGLGVGLAAIGAALSGSLSTGLATPWSLLAVWLGGVVITLGSAVLPSLRASRARPLEALRPAPEMSGRRRLGIPLTITCVLLFVAGGALLVLGWRAPAQSLLITIAGAFLVALGILLAARAYVPPLVRVVAALPARASVTSRLAGQNASRNPGRTAATCLALMLTVGLIVTLQVGAASTRASAEAGLANRYPVPLSLQTWDDAGLPADLVGRLAAVDGVGEAVGIQAASVRSDSFSRVLGVGADVERVAPGRTVRDDEILVAPDSGYGLTEGQRLTVTGDRGSVTLTVHTSHLSTIEPVVSQATVQRLTTRPVLAEIWASVPDQTPGNARQVVAGAQDLVADQAAVTVGGSMAALVVMRQVLDVLLAIATALLGVAVLIALIGVGNTLGLSVLERGRESALLRALGLQRSQLRGMLAIEALLLALVGALIGIAAGIAFGWLGTHALLREMGQPAVYRIPGWMVLADVAVATVAGLLASVLPARRALRASPVEALAET